MITANDLYFCFNYFLYILHCHLSFLLGLLLFWSFGFSIFNCCVLSTMLWPHKIILVLAISWAILLKPTVITVRILVHYWLLCFLDSNQNHNCDLGWGSGSSLFMLEIAMISLDWDMTYWWSCIHVECDKKIQMRRSLWTGRLDWRSNMRMFQNSNCTPMRDQPKTRQIVPWNHNIWLMESDSMQLHKELVLLLINQQIHIRRHILLELPYLKLREVWQGIKSVQKWVLLDYL